MVTKTGRVNLHLVERADSELVAKLSEYASRHPVPPSTSALLRHLLELGVNQALRHPA